MKRTSSMITLLVVLLAALAAGQRTLPAVPGKTAPRAGLQQPAPSGPKYRPDSLLVLFRKGVTSQSMASAHAAVGASVVRAYRIVPGLQRVQLPKGTNLASALRAYRHNPAVQYAEPDYRVQITAPLSDPLFGQQWDMSNIGQVVGGVAGTPHADIDALDAWSITTGSSSVYVGVIDTGVDYNHPDLTANMWTAAFSFTDGGITCPANSRGLNPVYGSCDPMDDYGHGTHVAGTIGASGSNNLGVAGINWNVTIVPCKFLDNTGFGFDSDAVTCLEFFKDLKDNHGINVVATNNSWGGGGFSQALSDAIDANRQSGILFIAAAGNASLDNDTAGFFPADYFLPNVIAVAATDSNDAQAFFSDFGKRTVHLGAPGENILSTMLTSGPLFDPSGYGLLSGTSMATPHVTGVAALLAANGTTDWRAIKNLILAGGDTKPSLADTITGKRLNANGSLTCTNSPVMARLQPTGNTPNVAVGVPTLLAVLNINCATPSGNVTVTITPGNQVVTLKDDGNAPDQAAGDGIYSGQFTFNSPGQYTVAISDGETFTVNALVSYFYQPVAFNYRTITGTDLNLTDDDFAQITPGFPISFAGHPFSSLWVSNNGMITFDDSAFSDFDNTPLPATGPTTLVAPFWTDLFSPSPAQNVFWAVTGTTPNRELVVEWRNVIQFNSCTTDETVTFQAVFFESKSDILFNYLDPVFGGCASFGDYGAASTIGVQVSLGLANQFSFDDPSLDSNTSLLWTTTGPNMTN
ncbi:MAG TPA: S8 family serine peptidase, partial [Terriglobales bacterium]|nr:S8 family serine peptidase [Terriglobales bacterium]